MSEKVSLATLNSGGIVEAVDVALVKIADNIADIMSGGRNEHH